MKLKLIDLVIRLGLKLVTRYHNGTMILPKGMNLTIISSERSIVYTTASRQFSVRITDIEQTPRDRIRIGHD